MPTYLSMPFYFIVVGIIHQLLFGTVQCSETLNSGNIQTVIFRSSNSSYTALKRLIFFLSRQFYFPDEAPHDERRKLFPRVQRRNGEDQEAKGRSSSAWAPHHTYQQRPLRPANSTPRPGFVSTTSFPATSPRPSFGVIIIDQSWGALEVFLNFFQ